MISKAIINNDRFKINLLIHCIIFRALKIKKAVVKIKYTSELKKEIINQYKKGKSITKLSKEFKIPRTTIYHWVDMEVEKPINEFSLTRRDVYESQFKLERLELINKIQHFVITHLDIFKEKKLELVHLLAKQQYPIKTICRVLGMQPSTFYHDKNRKPEVYLIDEADVEFKPLIQSIFDESDGRFGGRKIRIQLVKDGHIISHQRVLRLMKEMDLKPNLPDENYNNYLKKNMLINRTLFLNQNTILKSIRYG